MASIREEKPEDIPAVRTLNERAFGQPSEAGLVDKLREACTDKLSLVAVEGDEVAGHILFTPVIIESGGNTYPGMGLAPMAVLPELQKRGIGSQLVMEGIDMLRERSCPYVIVLGHPEYYPRFGFEPASARAITCQWEGVPDEAFMVLVLDEPAMEGVSGVAAYRDEFNEAM